MVKIYYANDITVTGSIKRYSGDPISQSPPYPKLQISHTTVTSSISLKVIDYEDTLNVPVSEGVYKRIISSSIFSPDVPEYFFKLTADIADEFYFSSVTAKNYDDATTLGIEDEIAITVQQTQNFYKQKLKTFFPNAEQALMEENPKYGLFIESVGNFLDKMDQAIENLTTLTRIDEVPDDYIRYLAQVVGYETDDFTITNIALKSIVKEIFSIYSLRGTHKGFTNFFKSLGYKASLVEKWYEGQYKVAVTKPYVGLVGSSMDTENWKYSTLYGSEVTHPTAPDSSITYGALDLIRNSEDSYVFAELYTSDIYSVNLDPSTRFQATGKYSKSERLVNVFVEPLKELELVPNIIDQMLIYIEFLKPLHLKLVLTLLKEYEDNWWEEKTHYMVEYEQVREVINEDSVIFYDLELDGSKQTLGNVPRQGDDVQFGIGYIDSMVGDDTPTEYTDGPFSKIYASSATTQSNVDGSREIKSLFTLDMRWDSSPSASEYLFNPLTFNGDFTVHETDFSDFRLDSAVWEPFADGGEMTVKRISSLGTSGPLSSLYASTAVLQSAVITMNEHLEAYDLSALVGYSVP